MIEIKDKKDCSGCNACKNICPKNAIEMVNDEKGFRYPRVNRDLCIECNLCNKICPIKNKVKINNNPIAYACYNKNLEERLNSSSGGIFILLAKQILEKGGYVVGATYDEKFNVKHTIINDFKDIKLLQTSKYVQSDVSDIYIRVKELLESGKYILFTGTPCQIEGLNSFFVMKYDKLYLQDIICHGVPSPLVWKKYIEYRLEKDNEKPININFRNKDNGWKKFNLKFQYTSKEYKNNQTKDYYLLAFLKNVILRDSCYDCRFKKKNRISDITLADFWGVENILPDLFDDKGTSLVIISSDKGKELFEKIDKDIVKKEISFEDAIKFNKNMTSSVEKNKNRDKFFEKLNDISFDKLCKKYVLDNKLKNKVFRAIKRLVKN